MAWLRLGYDAWGYRRNADNWLENEPIGKRHFLDRGYTGHEHLDPFGFINMNARLYDPITGQFFSPDELASERPEVSPYSYCSNDPVNRTDPTGLWEHWVQRPDGDIYWNFLATSRNRTPFGEIYLGEAVEVFDEVTGRLKKRYNSNLTTATYIDEYTLPEVEISEMKPLNMEKHYLYEFSRAKGVENIGAAMAYLAHNLGLNPSTDPANMGTGPSEATRQAVQIMGQSIANTLPLTQGANVYSFIRTNGKQDIWKNDLNMLDQGLIIVSPFLWFIRPITPDIDFIIGVVPSAVDAGNSTFKNAQKKK